MKEIRIPLDNEDHAKLIKAKGDKTWRNFVMELAK